MTKEKKGQVKKESKRIGATNHSEGE